MRGIDLMHVPYKGSGQSVPAVISGDVPVLMTSLTVVLPFVQAGAVNLLGVTSAARYSELPNVQPLVKRSKTTTTLQKWAFWRPQARPQR